MTRVDAHVHVWDLERAAYPWLGDDLAPVNRTISFDEVLPSLGRAGIEAAVLVEAADNVEDTTLMLETARMYEEVAGVVVFLPLESPISVAQELEALAADPLVVGVRNLIHNNPDPDWLLQPSVDASLRLVEAAGLCFDLVSVLPRHLEHVSTLVERHPQLPIVIDHLSKPPIGVDGVQPWWELIADAAAHPTVFAKVSGLYAAAGDPAAWTVDLIRPFFERALDLFGSDRLMYGGDWPISILAGGYDRVWDGLSELFAELSEGERSAILGDTANRFYGLQLPFSP